ncbi:hypothetical protein JMF94_07575 [Desulfovibrio sp. UIB00]|uniref:hypothetical protein n=1 Tax=Desulfovibrio sp. UIB00 TaxID=2804314 RepID=UPI001F107B24|nr:hypothetical protein [Desulfovibrio sp. UIB00]MCH5144942.1 hypothetical protein [Desulfovibrio sp. UIB00]
MGTALQLETVATPYGTITNVHVLSRWPGGAPQDCRLLAEDTVPTPHGWLTPHHDPEDVRRSGVKSFSLYPNGMWRSLELQDQTSISTPLGDMPAEWLAWHGNGALKRILLRKGKLSGYWTEQDERKLASQISLSLHGQEVSAKVQGLRFYPSGALESVTFWPGETILLATPLGPMPVRYGCAFYESGALRSCEPARPVHVPTSTGQIAAYDPAASAICGDVNSLCFGEDGTVSGLVTAACSLRWQQGAEQKCMSPRLEKDQLTMLRTVVVPLRVEFLPNGLVRMDDGKQIMQAPAQGITVGPFVALPDMRENS